MGYTWDGTHDGWELDTWPEAIQLSDGPTAVHVTDEDALDDLPTSGRVGFTAPLPRGHRPQSAPRAQQRSRATSSRKSS